MCNRIRFLKWFLVMIVFFKENMVCFFILDFLLNMFVGLEDGNGDNMDDE